MESVTTIWRIRWTSLVKTATDLDGGDPNKKTPLHKNWYLSTERFHPYRTAKYLSARNRPPFTTSAGMGTSWFYTVSLTVRP